MKLTVLGATGSIGVSTLDVIALHPGRYEVFALTAFQKVDALAALPNVCCKLSGLVTEAAPDWRPLQLAPYVRHLVQVFGPDRLMWGSDWPHTDTTLDRTKTYPLTLKWFEEWVPDEAVRTTILKDTPSKLYGF